MIQRIALAALLLVLLSSVCMAQRSELKAIPIGSKGWQLDFTTSVPLFKIVQAAPGVDASADVMPVLGLGGGLSIYWGPVDDPDNAKTFTFNCPMFILSAREDDADKMDLMVAADIGFFDNRIRFGIAYEFGKLSYPRRRIAGVFSVGVDF